MINQDGHQDVGVFTVREEFDSRQKPTSYALSHVQQHGTPFVLIVRGDGCIALADRRPGWRDLVSAIGPSAPHRLPPRLARIVTQHATLPPPNHAATVAIVVVDVVVSVVGLEGSDDMFACSLWRLRRERALEEARRRYLLTKRECELLDHILQGETSAEIARSLSISLATADWHAKRLLVKTDSQNRTQMAARVLGWLPASP